MPSFNRRLCKLTIFPSNIVCSCVRCDLLLPVFLQVHSHPPTRKVAASNWDIFEVTAAQFEQGRSRPSDAAALCTSEGRCVHQENKAWDMMGVESHMHGTSCAPHGNGRQATQSQDNRAPAWAQQVLTADTNHPTAGGWTWHATETDRCDEWTADSSEPKRKQDLLSISRHV